MPDTRPETRDFFFPTLDRAREMFGLDPAEEFWGIDREAWENDIQGQQTTTTHYAGALAEGPVELGPYVLSLRIVNVIQQKLTNRDIEEATQDVD